MQSNSAPIHSKAMPVILHDNDFEAWLDGEVESACALAQPFPSQLMRVLQAGLGAARKGRLASPAQVAAQMSTHR